MVQNQDPFPLHPQEANSFIAPFSRTLNSDVDLVVYLIPLLEMCGSCFTLSKDRDSIWSNAVRTAKGREEERQRGTPERTNGSSVPGAPAFLCRTDWLV
eukprot:g896.t1